MAQDNQKTSGKAACHCPKGLLMYPSGYNLGCYENDPRGVIAP